MTSLGPDARTIRQLATELGVHRETVYAWIRSGVQRAGGRVRLEAVRVGGRLRVTGEALRAFLEALNPGADVETAEETKRRRKARTEAERYAEERLGWK